MATLTIRNLSDAAHRKLRLRAARHGRSMEGEVRLIIENACADEQAQTDPQALQQWVDDLYRGHPPADGVDMLLAERRREAQQE